MEDRDKLRYGMNTEITIDDISDNDKLIVLRNVHKYNKGKISMNQLADMICCRKLQMISILGSIGNL